MLTIGKHTYGTPKLLGRGNNVTIGSYTSIAEDVIIDCGFNHSTTNISTYPFHRLNSSILSNIIIRGDVNIGSDVWLATSTVIMSGVTIGDGAVIGMRCIVSKDVKPYEVVVGAPQRILRKRFTDEQIEKLLILKWWDKPDQEVIEIAPLLTSNKIEELFKLYNL